MAGKEDGLHFKAILQVSLVHATLAFSRGLLATDVHRASLTHKAWRSASPLALCVLL